jgi:cyclohexyl-isocyanide hydratase
MEDADVIDFVRRQGEQARYVTSVCTGALVLGAAGLLRGYKAATHWASMDNLAYFGAEAVNVRVCVDRNRITGGGVAAGIDFGLVLASKLVDQPTAEKIQLYMEYNPDCLRSFASIWSPSRQQRPAIRACRRTLRPARRLKERKNKSCKRARA